MTKARDLANSAAAFASVSATELGYVDGVTSAIQTQMDAKAPSSTAVTLTGTQTLTNKTLTSPVIASVINNTLTSTTGDIIYASAANTPARLGIGSSAQVLTVASGIPSWATPAAAGKLLQLVSATFATQTSSSSTTYADTGLTATITPTLNTSKILVMIALPINKSAGNAGNGVYLNIVRGATQIVEVGHVILYTGTALTNYGIASFNFQDSPATTSATAYKVQFKNDAAAAQIEVAPGNKTCTMILMEIGA